MGISDIISSLVQLTKITKLEGEGLGTSYEYIAKYSVLLPILEGKTIDTVLIYGLPEKYGYSMDFILLGLYLNASKIIIIDDRFDKLNDAEKILKIVLNEYNLDKNLINQILTVQTDLTNPGIKNPNLILSCEVLQRFDKVSRFKIAGNIRKADNYAVFVPNGKNEAHAKISRLNTLYLDELRELFSDSQYYGYIDCPPNPPGIKMAKEKTFHDRKSSFKEKILIDILGLWFNLTEKKLLQLPLLRWYYENHAHIVFAVRCK